MKPLRNILFLTFSTFFLTSTSFASFFDLIHVLKDDLGNSPAVLPYRAYVAKIDPSRQYLAIAGGDGTGSAGIIKIYNLQSATPLTVVASTTTGFDIYDFSWDPTGAAGTFPLVVAGVQHGGPAPNLQIYQFVAPVTLNLISQATIPNNFDAFDVHWSGDGLTILVCADDLINAWTEVHVYDTALVPHSGNPGSFMPTRANYDAHSVSWEVWTSTGPGQVGGTGNVFLADPFGGGGTIAKYNVTAPGETPPVPGGPISIIAGPSTFFPGASAIALDREDPRPAHYLAAGGYVGDGQAAVFSLLLVQQGSNQYFGGGIYPKDVGWEYDVVTTDTFAVVGYAASAIVGRVNTGLGRLCAYHFDGSTTPTAIANSIIEFDSAGQVWGIDWLNTDTVSVGGLNMTSPNDVALYHRSPPALPPPPPPPPSPNAYGSTVLTLDFGLTYTVFVVKWDPSNTYLAVGGGDGVSTSPGKIGIYDAQLNLLASKNIAFDVYDLDWDSDEHCIAAVGKYIASVGNVAVYHWDGGSTLTKKYAQSTSPADAFAVYWSPASEPNDNLMVFAGDTSQTKVYAFSNPAGALLPIWGSPFSLSEIVEPYAHSVSWENWNNDSETVDVVVAGIAPSYRVYLYNMGMSPLSILSLDSDPLPGVSTVEWQSGGGIIAAGAFDGTDGNAYLYSWDGSTLLMTDTEYFGGGIYPKDIDWVNTQTLAMVGYASGGGDRDATGVGRLYLYRMDSTTTFTPVIGSLKQHTNAIGQTWSVDWKNTNTLAVGGLSLQSPPQGVIYYKKELEADPPPPAVPPPPHRVL